MKNGKIIFIVAAIFLLAAGCSQNAGIRNQESGSRENQQTQTGKQETTASQTSAETENLVPKGLPAAGQQTVTQTVEGSAKNQPSYNYTEQQTALQLLKATHTVETKVYGSIGEFVLSIDGIKPDSRHFWEFIVNGKSSSVGASAYAVKAGDKIEWKLTEIR